MSDKQGIEYSTYTCAAYRVLPRLLLNATQGSHRAETSISHQSETPQLHMECQQLDDRVENSLEIGMLDSHGSHKMRIAPQAKALPHL